MKKEKKGKKEKVTAKSAASKKTLNLIIQEQGISQPGVFIPLILVILVVAGLLGFLVTSRISAVNAAQREVDEVQLRLSAMEAAYADYDELLTEYNRYTYRGFDNTLAERMDVLRLMENRIMSVCYVQRFTLDGRELGLSLEGPSLLNNSQLIDSLNADKLVDGVHLSNFNAAPGSSAIYPVTDMVIVLADASKTGDEQKGEVGQ